MDVSAFPLEVGVWLHVHLYEQVTSVTSQREVAFLRHSKVDTAVYSLGDGDSLFDLLVLCTLTIT